MDEALVIGGAEIYTLALPRVNRMYMTRVHHAFEGDAFFPPYQDSDWQEILREEHHSNNPNEPLNYSFITLEKR